ncbi:MAG: hypothetical protein AABZ08_00060 [Planctomycetota bacterium]
MAFAFGAQCDDFHIATRLFLKLELALQREALLHFFDSVKREHPALCKLRRREDGALLLEEEETENNARCWLRLDENALRFGQYNPPKPEDAHKFAQSVLKMAPYHLTLSELDYDHLEVVIGFDLEYRGNHDQLVAETLFGDSPLAGLIAHESVTGIIDAQPFLGISVTDNCDTQVYLEIKSRTSTFEIRTQQFEHQPLSVFLTLR